MSRQLSLLRSAWRARCFSSTAPSTLMHELTSVNSKRRVPIPSSTPKSNPPVDDQSLVLAFQQLPPTQSLVNITPSTPPQHVQALVLLAESFPLPLTAVAAGLSAPDLAFPPLHTRTAAALQHALALRLIEIDSSKTNAEQLQPSLLDLRRVATELLHFRFQSLMATVTMQSRSHQLLSNSSHLFNDPIACARIELFDLLALVERYSRALFEDAGFDASPLHSEALLCHWICMCASAAAHVSSFHAVQPANTSYMSLLCAVLPQLHAVMSQLIRTTALSSHDHVDICSYWSRVQALDQFVFPAVHSLCNSLACRAHPGASLSAARLPWSMFETVLDMNSTQLCLPTHASIEAFAVSELLTELHQHQYLAPADRQLAIATAQHATLITNVVSIWGSLIETLTRTNKINSKRDVDVLVQALQCTSTTLHRLQTRQQICREAELQFSDLISNILRRHNGSITIDALGKEPEVRDMLNQLLPTFQKRFAVHKTQTRMNKFSFPAFLGTVPEQFTLSPDERSVSLVSHTNAPSDVHKVLKALQPGEMSVAQLESVTSISAQMLRKLLVHHQASFVLSFSSANAIESVALRTEAMRYFWITLQQSIDRLLIQARSV